MAPSSGLAVSLLDVLVHSLDFCNGPVVDVTKAARVDEGRPMRVDVVASGHVALEVAEVA